MLYASPYSATSSLSDHLVDHDAVALIQDNTGQIMRHNRNSDPQCVAPVFLRKRTPFPLQKLEHNNRHTDADLHPDDT